MNTGELEGYSTGRFFLISETRSSENIERWQSERLRCVSPGTVKKESMWLKHLLSRAVRWGYLRDTLAKNIDRVKEPPRRIRYLTPEERSSLLHHARHDLRPFIFIAMQTGARQGSYPACDGRI